MKLRFLILIFSICYFASASFAQNGDFAVKVFSQNTNSEKNNKSVSFIIKRTPNAEFDTKQKINIWFYLLRCPKTENCKTIDDEYLAVGSIKGKKMAKTETLALNMNLADFYWKPTMSSIDLINAQPNFSDVPKENKYFYVEINVCKKPETREKKATEVCTSYVSNEIILNLNH